MYLEISKIDDPESKLKAELGRLSEDESKEALQLKVNAGNCGGVDQVDRIAKALVRLSKRHWKLMLLVGWNGLESVPESVWELANLEELGLDHNELNVRCDLITWPTFLGQELLGNTEGDRSASVDSVTWHGLAGVNSMTWHVAAGGST